ncbi:unnamed protein product [Lathyrus sativus]|nr:unnamed protein product [Lathyrus sativus]
MQVMDERVYASTGLHWWKFFFWKRRRAAADCDLRILGDGRIGCAVEIVGKGRLRRRLKLIAREWLEIVHFAGLDTRKI